jgi:hypothetical protein
LNRLRAQALACMHAVYNVRNHYLFAPALLQQGSPVTARTKSSSVGWE